jgi:thioredoxin-like negative regulator of GroEL
MPIVYQSPTTRVYAGRGRGHDDPIALDDARPLLVFFSSRRSGPSRRMESLIAHLARRERSRLRVVQLDLDERADLAARLAVDAAPALVLVVENRVVARLEGRASATRIDALLEAHLHPAAA